MNMIEKTRTECISCKKCTKHCPFLQKYGMNLKDFTFRPDLRKSCFMCGVCTQVCPLHLAGEKIALELRQAAVQRSPFAGYLKNHYPFRRPPRLITQSRSFPDTSQPGTTKYAAALLFLGCNYPGFFPKTSAALTALCKERGIDTFIDCCKKPVYEQGGQPQFSGIEAALVRAGADTLICACPNCYHFLKDKLSCTVVSVYQFLSECGIGKQITETPAVFFPCSDRVSREIFQFIQPYINSHTEPYRHINCCGLGGGARKYEPDCINDIKQRLLAAQETLSHGNAEQENAVNIYTYCATCAGAFTSYGLKNVKNFLAEILGTHESSSRHYALNVVRAAFGK